MGDFFERVAALRRDGERFAVATVVGRRAPVSAHLGDRAIVFADGRMDGYVGGACSREIVRKQALESLRTRQARLVSIRPDASEAAASSSDEHVIVPMTCVSEGAVDVYVEPFVRARRLVVVGATPVADALMRVARSLDYDVVRVVDRGELGDVEPRAAAVGATVTALDALGTALSDGHPDLAVVVASQGHYDEEALETILKTDVPYAGLVASRKRGATVRALLEKSGVPRVSALHNPAGLDLGARTAPEVALSILAEIVQAQPGRIRSDAPAQAGDASTAAARAATHPPPVAERPPSAAPGTAVDPVCGMDVTVATARHKAEVGGVLYYFCCAPCRVKFTEDPDRYLASRS
jgi:xanthine dehydrogenase accessory factor